jgi:hypothetical protein
MKKKTVIPQKKKRGPPATGKGEPVVVRMHGEQLRAIDAWIAAQDQPFPSRPEAVRRLVNIGLNAHMLPKERRHRGKNPPPAV